MNQSEHINELIAALSKAQAEILPALKDTSNPFFKSKYADLSSVWNACRAPLTKNGLAVVQTVDMHENGQSILLTTLAHSSGQWIVSRCPIVVTKQDAQGFGSALTYFRRYNLASICGVCPDDDDGNAACAGAPRPAKLITKEAAKSLEDVIGPDMEFMLKVLDYYKIDTLEKLPVEHFQIVMDKAKDKKK